MVVAAVMVMVMALAAVRNMQAQHVTKITITNHSCSLRQSSFPALDTLAGGVHYCVFPSVHGHSLIFYPLINTFFVLLLLLSGDFLFLLHIKAKTPTKRDKRVKTGKNIPRDRKKKREEKWLVKRSQGIKKQSERQSNDKTGNMNVHRKT